MADTESVRTCGLEGLERLLGQAWARFERPLAVTEAHLAGTRDEQLRWLMDTWDAVVAARDAGIGVCAVTAWPLLGAFDWDSLCVAPRGRYEPGAFDVRSPTPRPTAIAAAIRDLAGGRRHQHPVLAGAGWWRR